MKTRTAGEIGGVSSVKTGYYHWLQARTIDSETRGIAGSVKIDGTVRLGASRYDLDL